MTTIKIAVYGTLRRGGWNHDRYMAGYLCVESCTLPGKLGWLSPQIPMLEVPEEEVLAIGTRDYLADARLQERLDQEFAPLAERTRCGAAVGEIYTFNDPEAILPPLDRLEGFRPGQQSLYRRVLVRTGEGALAWVYAAPMPR